MKELRVKVGRTFPGRGNIRLNQKNGAYVHEITAGTLALFS